MQYISERFQMMFQGLKALFMGIPVEREMFPIDLSVGLRIWHHKVTERALAESKDVALVAPFNLLFSGKGQDFAAALAIFDEALKDETDYAALRQQVIAMHDELTRIPYQTQERAWVEQMNQYRRGTVRDSPLGAAAGDIPPPGGEPAVLMTFGWPVPAIAAHGEISPERNSMVVLVPTGKSPSDHGTMGGIIGGRAQIAQHNSPIKAESHSGDQSRVASEN